MARVVVIGDLMTDAVARATLPLARGSDTPANVTMHGGRFRGEHRRLDGRPTAATWRS
jgi:hypothetical protein